MLDACAQPPPAELPLHAGLASATARIFSATHTALAFDIGRINVADVEPGALTAEQSLMLSKTADSHSFNDFSAEKSEGASAGSTIACMLGQQGAQRMRQLCALEAISV